MCGSGAGVNGVKFAPGSIVATPAVLEAFRAAGDDPLAYLVRHLSGDWENVDEHDRRKNELSVTQGFRVLSSYRMSNGTRFWIITEADRSITTVPEARDGAHAPAHGGDHAPLQRVPDRAYQGDPRPLPPYYDL